MALLQQRRRKTDCDWARGLPVNIMDDILDRLVDLSDYIRFASVCVPWRSVALDDRNHRGKKNKVDCPQIPMLMVTEYMLHKDDKVELYSLTREKILNFQPTVPAYNLIIGSSLGWLIYINYRYNVSVSLFNPFSASIIRLPNIIMHSDIRRNRRNKCNEPNEFDYRLCTVKATLSKDPALYPDEYVVLLIYGKTGKLVYIKPGQAPRWQQLPTGKSGFCDVVYSKSSCLFLGVLRTGEVCSIDIDGRGGVDCFTPDLRIRGRDDGRDDDDLRYVVETPSGELLQVYRFLSPPTSYVTFRTLKIKVFKFLKTLCCWSELKTLGDNALFVGHGSSTCVSASDFPGCRLGSVYYSLPYKRYFVIASYNCPDHQDTWHSDMGVVDVNTERVECFKFKYPNHVWSVEDLTLHAHPVWVVPTFQERPRKEDDIVRKRPRKEDILPTYDRDRVSQKHIPPAAS